MCVLSSLNRVLESGYFPTWCIIGVSMSEPFPSHIFAMSRAFMFGYLSGMIFALNTDDPYLLLRKRMFLRTLRNCMWFLEDYRQEYCIAGNISGFRG